MEVDYGINVFLEFFYDVFYGFFLNDVKNYRCYRSNDEGKNKLVLNFFEVWFFLMVYFDYLYYIEGNDYD